MSKKITVFFILFLYTFSYNIYSMNFYNNVLNSDSVYMINYDTEMAVVEKNINKKRSPASLTKIVTFLVAYENTSNRDETKIKVSKEVLDLVDPESSGNELKVGDELSINNLINYMMISSSGSSAMVLANYVGGNIENFVSMMNQKIAQFGCTDTHFENPDGIYNSNQYTTASDMYKITKYAMNNKDFLNLVSKSECNIFGDERDPIITTNKMIDRKRGGKYYLPWVKGIKTGFIDDAGRCLISYAVKDNNTYICVVMGGPFLDDEGKKLEDNTAMIDTFNLYTWAFENLEVFKICERYFPLTQIDLKFVLSKNKLILSSDSNIKIVLPKEAHKEDVSFEYELPEYVEAPIEKGDIIGKANLIYDGEKIFSLDLVSPETYKKNYFLLILNFIYKIITSKIFIFSLLIVLLIMLVYIYYTINYNRKRRRRSKIINISKFKKYK